MRSVNGENQVALTEHGATELSELNTKPRDEYRARIQHYVQSVYGREVARSVDFIIDETVCKLPNLKTFV